MKRGDRCRLLSLPDELLESIFSTVTHPSDRRNVALVCSRLRRISRRTPHSLLVEFIPHHHRHSSVRDWLGDFDDKTRAFPNITSLTVRVTDTLRDYLLAGIGATCGQLKELKLLAVDWGRFEATAVTPTNHSLPPALALAMPPLINPTPLFPILPLPPLPTLPPTTLLCLSPFARPDHLLLFQPAGSSGVSLRFSRDSSRYLYEDTPALPPLHAFPSLRALTLSFRPKEISPLLRCSALTSLSLWQPTGSDLACLASSSSAFRSSLQSLTIRSADLTNHLPCVSSFTLLSSLSLHSCMFDPCELHSLSRSLHSLTHFTIHGCPLACCRAVATMVRANPSLSTLSLSGTTYRLFIPRPLSTVLRLSSRKLQTLTLSGLPSFRPGMLAGCSSLESLTLERAEGSLEGLLGMLVRVEEAEGGAERGADTPSGAGADAGAGAPTAAAEGGISGRQRTYVDIRTAAAAAHADAASAWSDARRLLKRAGQFQTHSAHQHESVQCVKSAISAVLSAIAACRYASAGVWDANAAREKARAVARISTAAAAAGTSGILSAQLTGEEEEENGEIGEDTMLFSGYEEYSAGATPNAVHNGTEESEAGDGEAVTVMSREELLVVLESLSEQLRLRLSVMHESADSLLRWENVADQAEAPAAVAAAAAAAAAVEAPAEVVPGVQEEGAQREEAEGEGRGGGESCSSSAAAMAFSRAPPCSTLRPAISLSFPGSTLSAPLAQQQQSFESIALAAVFGGLRRLAVVQCGGVVEEQLRAVLRACRVLVELRVEHCDAMSDKVLLSCSLHSLTHATLVSCTQVTAAGVAGLLGSFPGLRYLKVEGEKVSERARRKLLRAGVVVRGCEFDVGMGVAHCTRRIVVVR
ncbi:unnamed protein product [Closterium sp. Naga37s-1]|nr:unnamed protein product [Closterium sp. Naga37s-1]